MKDIAKVLVYGGLFAVPFVVLIISNSLFFPFVTGKNFAFRIIVEVMFSAWVILALYDAQYRPKFSWIVASFLGFLGIMAFANALGENPLRSFWSNFERMDGYVTLVHLFLYIIVAGSVLITEKLWDRYFNTIIGVGIIVALYAFAQMAGSVDAGKGWRLEGTLGNAAYMAIYALFLIFCNAYMLVRTKSVGARYVYGALIALFGFFLVQTATRGTMLGFVGGLCVAVTYVALFTKTHPTVRKTAIGVLVALVVLVGLFVAVKDTAFVQNNQDLRRIANISLSEGSTRLTVWGMALEGVEARPLLGWGQSNYNYVFNEYFRPELYGQESWFDRVHNIVMDWLVAGGVLGALAYFSILFSAVYYLFVRPLMREDATFSVIERGVLLGVLAGYTVHNVFVFDNIVSYIFYGTILAYIHARVGVLSPRLRDVQIDTRLIGQIIAPVIIVVCVVVVYVVNVPHMRAAHDLIKALRAEGAGDYETMLVEFDNALSHHSFGDQEIREQFMQRGQEVLALADVPAELKQRLGARIESEILTHIEESPRDARTYALSGGFYRATGQIEKARAQLAQARALSPRKQVLIVSQGYVEIQAREYEAALQFFKEAHELSPQVADMRAYYAAAGLYVGRQDILEELIQTDGQKRAFARNSFALQAAYHAKLFPLLKEMFLIRIAENPQDKQLRATFAYILNEMGDKEGAIASLVEAAEEIESFEADAERLIEQIKNGRGVGGQ